MIRTLKIILLAIMTASLMTSALAQGQSKRTASPAAKDQKTAAAREENTPGRIAKFTATRTVGDSNITEDDFGNIGIGITVPTSLLTVGGLIETTTAAGGVKFPDGTVQTTAGLTSVLRDGTLKGNGTAESRLGVQVPLALSSSLFSSPVLLVGNSSQNGFGIQANGGPGGLALRAFGGRGGLGIEALGGQNDGGIAGDGLRAFGGLSNGGSGGTGVLARGGTGSGIGNTAGHGIEAFPGFGLGIANGLAGKFNGNVQVNGTLSKAGGSFKIDHPIDPENKYLSHSFVESPDMMNIYNGNIITDQNGLATVKLPGYFDALNRDFRYQLTVVGQFAQAIVAEEVKDNSFVIQTNMPGVKVSWQVTGIRQDAWANNNRIPVEENKSEKERGHYLHPEAFGLEEERSVNWANNPELMLQLKQSRLEEK